MRFVPIALLLFITGCVPPVYEKTTFVIDDFIADSCEISQGKFAILELEGQDCDCGNASEGIHDCHNDVIIDGDVLAVSLYHPKRPDRMAALRSISEQTGFQVRDGKICLPHISSLDVGGLTLHEAKEKLQTAYCEELPQSQIFVNFKLRRERQVQIIGAANPMVPVDGRTRLFEVLAKAGIAPYANLFKSYVMRDGQQLPVDLYKLVHEGDECQNIFMQGGDQIFIARASDAMVMVTGEIPRPMSIPIPYGFISLREALALAGDIPYAGDKCHIYVIRGNFVKPKVYELAWRQFAHLPNQSLLLMDGDVVYITEKPITQWNRFIEQLQPSIFSVQTGSNCYYMFVK